MANCDIVNYFFLEKTKDNITQKAVQRSRIGNMYAHKNRGDERVRIQSARLEIGQMLRTDFVDSALAAIASSRTRLATLSGVMCNTSQCELRSLRVNSGMLNVIRIVTYTLPRIESPTSSWIAMAYSR